LTRLLFQFVFLFACLAVMAGCEKTSPAGFRFNEVEWIKQENTHRDEGEGFDEAYRDEIGNILTALFGTPDAPRFPSFMVGDDKLAEQIVSLDNLRMAAGPTPVDKRDARSGLFREHCVHCHGITGDGAGPTALELNPYPRDFRLGKFKFKSTPLRQSPTDHDLTKILENGIPGTAMPSFRTLPEEEIKALVQYVKYLTMRGQMERYLMSMLAELDDDGLSFINLSLISESKDGKPPSDDALEEFEDQMYTVIADGFIDGILARWLKPDKKVTEIPAAPTEFVQTHADHQAFVDRGRELFFAKGNCMQCHGDTGVGDGQLSTFDDWTNDWKTANVDLLDPATYEEYTNAGVLPARPIRPRNLNIPIYRGGDRPNDLYLRLANGIEGTPMPASSAMTSDETWAVVAYVESLPFIRDALVVPKPINDQQVAQ
jgi:mono/diheme cytochrome c family protein